LKVAAVLDRASQPHAYRARDAGGHSFSHGASLEGDDARELDDGLVSLVKTVRIDPAVVRRLHARAGGERWRVSMDRLAEALSESADRAFGGKPASTDDVERYLTGLHLEDLALACACMAGDEEAWEHVVREYRPALYRTAAVFDPTGGARDLADSLYGELFATTETRGERRSLLRYFHGRSSLSTWLRSVLTQRLVGRLRATKRERPLPDEESLEALPAPERPSNPERERHVTVMRAALGSAIAALDARDRLRLGCYYAEELTLAETGRVLHEHEATVSRQLARTRQAIKAEVERQLREEIGLSHEAIGECFASIAADAGPLDLRELVGLADPVESRSRKERAAGHSKKEQRV